MNTDTIVAISALLAAIESIRRLAKNKKPRSSIPIFIFAVAAAALLTISYWFRPTEKFEFPIGKKTSHVIKLRQTTGTDDVGGHPQLSINHTLSYDPKTGALYGEFTGSIDRAQSGGRGTAVIDNGRYIISGHIGLGWESWRVLPIDNKTDTINDRLTMESDSSKQNPPLGSTKHNTYIAAWKTGAIQVPTIQVVFKDEVQILFTKRTWIFERFFNFFQPNKAQ